MNILYGFSNCTYRKYNELFKDSPVMVLQQAQKYHSLMIRGLKENGVGIQCISGLPINRSANSSLYIEGGNDIENGVVYHYFSSINLPIFRQLTIAFKAFCYTISKRKVNIAICDILNISILIGILLACRIRRIPIIGIVTDVPGKLAQKKQGLSKCINAFFMKKMDGYIFLTKWMNDIVNPNKKPYVVIEGQVDSDMEKTSNALSEKHSPKVLMYAGTLKKIYGIKKLTEAFLSVNNPEWILHIYGDGDFREDLIEISHKYSNVVYKGIKLNAEIVRAEMESSLLVNPRPTDEEYVKYSFPSKNMEYLASGTPLLTTHLPGMPDEYLEHVYLFDDETVEGMTKTLDSILSLKPESLYQKGCEAKKFVLQNKNQRCQANTVYSLLNQIVK